MSFCVQTRQQRLTQRHCVIAADGKLQLGQAANGGLHLQVSLPA